MLKIAAYMIAALFTASAAQATVIVNERIVQKGLFVKAGCKPDTSDPSYDACTCDADIRVPEVAGMADEKVQAALNTIFAQTAERAKCEGDPVKDEAPKNKEASPSSASHHYEVKFQSPTLLGLEFTDWGYTGGAHGNGTVDGMIIDLTNGKIISINDLFDPKDIPAVNQAIYDVLVAKPEEEVFRDQVESRKGEFIKDGQCQGCTLTLNPDGIKVVFQTYEVAPYAVGNMEVPIPTQYISYPAITQVLVPEKKGN